MELGYIDVFELIVGKWALVEVILVVLIEASF
jgi:hypothetical protein